MPGSTVIFPNLEHLSRCCNTSLFVMCHHSLVTCILPLCVSPFHVVAFALLVRLSSSAEEWFNQCESASVPALPCVCFVVSGGKTLMLYSSHVTYTRFIQHSHSNTHGASHTYTQALDNASACCLRFFFVVEMHQRCVADSHVPFQAGGMEQATKHTALWKCPSARCQQKVPFYFSFHLSFFILATIHILGV